MIGEVAALKVLANRQPSDNSRGFGAVALGALGFGLVFIPVGEMLKPFYEEMSTLGSLLLAVIVVAAVIGAAIYGGGLD